jgi:putative ABC transport system substrate-binding protein
VNRREFITLLGGAAALPFAARAQGDHVRRLGVLMSTGERDPETELRVGAFREGLQKLGWAEGLRTR